MQWFYGTSSWSHTRPFSTKSNDFLGDISDLAPNTPIVFPQLTSPPSVFLPAQNENSCSIRCYVLVNCCRVWGGRNNKLFIWIYNTCRIRIHHVLGTKTRAVTMTLLMRMTMTDWPRLQTSGQVCATNRVAGCELSSWMQWGTTVEHTNNTSATKLYK